MFKFNEMQISKKYENREPSWIMHLLAKQKKSKHEHNNNLYSKLSARCIIKHFWANPSYWKNPDIS